MPHSFDHETEDLYPPWQADGVYLFSSFSFSSWLLDQKEAAMVLNVPVAALADLVVMEKTQMVLVGVRGCECLWGIVCHHSYHPVVVLLLHNLHV